MLKRTVLLTTLALVGSPLALRAQLSFCTFDPARSPAVAAPSAYWGALQPAGSSAIPPDRDNTGFDDQVDPFDEAHPFWMSLAHEGGYLFTALNAGLQIWDVGTHPDQPQRLSVVGASGFPFWPSDPFDRSPVQPVAVPDGNDRRLDLI